MFAKYYQSEIQYLREMGRLFGQANPDVAGLLGERGGDPDVERLLEGFAFLTAQIRERVEDAVPEIAVALADLLLPHYVRTIPATTIVEFTGIPGAVRGRQRVARGAEVAAVPVDGTSCRFRTAMDVDLLPLAVSDVTMDRVGSATPMLRASFRIAGPGHAAVFAEGGLRLHVHGEPPVATTLMLWLMRHLSDVVVEAGPGKSVSLGGARALRWSGIDEANALLPWPRLGPGGYRLLQEYFVLPAKLLFFDVHGLERAAELVGDSDRFDLVFQFERPPDLPARPGRDALRLFCTPVVNLWSGTADPLVQDTPGREHLVRAAEVDPLHMEVYSIDSVVGARPGRAERRSYARFFDYTHAAGGGGAAGAPGSAQGAGYYSVRRRRSELDDAIDTYVSVLTPRNVAPPAGASEETLSLDVTCTNRGLPARLRVGDVSAPTASSPTTARFRNIGAVTRPVRPPLGSELHWRLLSHLALAQRSLADVGALRALLGLYNFVAEADEQVGLANRLRVDAIREVAAHPARRILEGASVRGVRFGLELDERSFASRGDAFLFGTVIDELLGQHVTMNSFTELVARLQPSQAEYTWAPRNGSRPIV